MENHGGMKPGEHICLYKKILHSAWECSCVADYASCMARADDLAQKYKGASIMIVAIVSMAKPNFALQWTSALGEKITKG